MEKGAGFITIILIFPVILIAQNNLFGLQIGEMLLTRDYLKKSVFYRQISLGYEGKFDNRNTYWNTSISIGRANFDYNDTSQNSNFEQNVHVGLPIGLRKYYLSKVGTAKGGMFWGLGVTPNSLMIRTVEIRRTFLISKKTDYFSGFHLNIYAELGHRFFLTQKWAIDIAIFIHQNLYLSSRSYGTNLSKSGLIVSFARRTKNYVWERK
jgi:hypothetical protein